MHMTAVLDAIKKRGHFYEYDKAEKVHKKTKKAVESARAALSLLNSSRTKAKRYCKKKARETTEKAFAKALDSESEAKEAKEAYNVNNNSMKAGFLEDLEKAKQAQSTAKGAITAAASKLFTFYLNLLSPESKYSWNKIVGNQMESDPYVNLQGDVLEGPRGMSCDSFNNCMMFHLLTVFPINADEQEKYYISNILKKSQRINVRQFVQRVEQLNAYIPQMPCFYYSPNANANTKPKNVPFTEAELRAHVLRMCPIQWQDQYNMNKKGMMPMDMRSLLTHWMQLNASAPMRRANWILLRNPTSLPIIERKGRNALVPILRSGFPRKSALRRIANYARSMGAHTPCMTLMIFIGLRRTERRNPVSVPLRKADIIGIP